MLIRLLGSVEVADATGWRRGGPPKQACVLACLALSPGTAISIESLTRRLWSGSAPIEARNIIYGHVTRLRRLLEKHETVALQRVGTSQYRLDIAPELVDASRMRGLASQARATHEVGDLAKASRQWRAAVGLWRGPALAGIKSDWAVRMARRMTDGYIAAVAELGECELALGRPEAVADDLEPIVGRFPLAENLLHPFLLALHQCGRTSEALDRYTETRRQLRETLGNEPTERLRTLHKRILRQDPQLLRANVSADVPTPDAPDALVRSPVPAQLPAGVPRFTGRAAELGTLNELVASTDDGRLATISGMAGVGKSALAVHWSHRVVGRFPDGQLYANLRGFDPSGDPMDPDEVITDFLDALDVDTARIPATLDARAGLFRSLVASRRLLVLLDNARDEEQVRPLLPGASGCFTVVTSRSRLLGLTAGNSARPLIISGLSNDESRSLLAGRLGKAQLAADPAAVDTIIERCARLPLALAVVAARAATMPEVRLRELAAELGRTSTDLDAFAMTDASTNVRAVFSWSYRLLGPGAATLFELMGAHPGPDITAAAAAALTGADAQRTQALLDELISVHLVGEHAPGRYLCHELLRAYATELNRTHATMRDADTALTRVLDYYVRTARAGSRLLHPHRELPEAPRDRTGVIAQPLADHDAALNWFEAERLVLRAVLGRAASRERHGDVVQLAAALMVYLDRRGHWSDLVAIQESALAAASALADGPSKALVHRNLGRAYSRVGRFDDAHLHNRSALDRYREYGDLTGQARISQQEATLLALRGRYREALDASTRALNLGERAGDLVTQAVANNSIGWHSARFGDYTTGLRHCRRADQIAEQIQYREIMPAIWDSLGFIHHRLGEPGRAFEFYQRANDGDRVRGDRLSMASSWERMGDVKHSTGDEAAAVSLWRQALAMLDEIGHPDAEPLRAKIQDGRGQW
ncbi:MAG: AfsR/SARP family transcriptional regulator [Stackebrandtia sp.]